MLAPELMELIPKILLKRRIGCLDLTGGAPEMHRGFRDLVKQARKCEVEVIDRCNLTILSEPGQEDLAKFLATNQVHVVASLPCYLENNVNMQRGEGVFERSIHGLRQLNKFGYGSINSSLQLDLVYNPIGPVLPPSQESLEADYKRELGLLDIKFNHLLTLANMPIQRFADQLASRGELDSYKHLLKNAHNSANISHVMCGNLLNIDWQGKVYDCDFNQQLGLPALGRIKHLRDLLDSDELVEGQAINTDQHCFGCTAGAGSSCGGALQTSEVSLKSLEASIAEKRK